MNWYFCLTKQNLSLNLNLMFQNQNDKNMNNNIRASVELLINHSEMSTRQPRSHLQN